MRKVPTVFVRTFDAHHRITACGPAVTPGCEWVLAGEGAATLKWDGEAYRVHYGKLWRRYDAKPGRTPPPGAEPCESKPDPITGHWPHWIPVTLEDPAMRVARETFAFLVARDGRTPEDGTYELVGPSVQRNPHRLDTHEFRRHGAHVLSPREPWTYATIRAWLEAHPQHEGLVFHHPDGLRAAKIKRSDLGLAWPPKES